MTSLQTETNTFSFEGRSASLKLVNYIYIHMNGNVLIKTWFFHRSPAEMDKIYNLEVLLYFGVHLCSWAPYLWFILLEHTWRLNLMIPCVQFLDVDTWDKLELCDYSEQKLYRCYSKLKRCRCLCDTRRPQGKHSGDSVMIIFHQLLSPVDGAHRKKKSQNT